MQNINQSNISPCLNVEDDEISLWDMVSFLKEGWRWLVGGVALGLVAAVAFVLFAPTQYEATAVLQPATVGLPTTTTTTKGAEVEPAAQTLERLKMPTFFTQELVQVCQVPPAQALAAGLKSSQLKGGSLIQISFRAPSVAVAQACVAAVVVQLAKSQAEIASPIIKALEEQLAVTRQRLSEAEAFQVQLEKRAGSANMSSLLLWRALGKGEEVARLQKQLLEQSVQLSAPVTQPLQLLEPISAPEDAVFPKKTAAIVGGLIGGFVAGLLALFVSRSRRRYLESQC